MKIKKNQAIYINKDIESYNCGNCMFYVEKELKCHLHKPEEIINSKGSCNLFLKGEKLFLLPASIVDKNISGYTEEEEDISCKNCVHFIKDLKDCNKVDKYSEGYDKNFICETGCCNLWESQKSIEKNKKNNSILVEGKRNNINDRIQQKIIDISNKSPETLPPHILNNIKKNKG